MIPLSRYLEAWQVDGLPTTLFNLPVVTAAFKMALATLPQMRPLLLRLLTVSLSPRPLTHIHTGRFFYRLTGDAVVDLDSSHTDR